ncbi:MAG: low specificity L-threonine aldolase [Pseudomonadota bacterium]
MNFTSDNAAGMHDDVLAALAQANPGHASSYGADDLSRRVEERFAEIFERDVGVFMVATGTAANAVSLAAMTEPFGGVICHKEAHIVVDECGAPEFYTGGARLVGLPGDGCKLSPDTVSDALASYSSANQHSIQPRVLSLTQATEAGRVYTVDEVSALAEVAHERGLSVQMDGARFGNAVAWLDCAPADITWRAGVDVLSFGATKNGCLAAEAIIIFDRVKADEVRFRRKRGGHLWSKARFLAAQFDAYLANDNWLKWAGEANARASELSTGLSLLNSVEIAWPTEANEVFAIMPKELKTRFEDAGGAFYAWPGEPPRPLASDEVLTRLVCAFSTTPKDVEDFLSKAV